MDEQHLYKDDKRLNHRDKPSEYFDEFSIFFLSLAHALGVSLLFVD